MVGLWYVVRGLWLVACGWWSVVGLWCVVCGVWLVVCGLWSVAFGLWFVVFGLWPVAGGLWLVVYGWWSVVGLWYVVCGVWLVVCGLWFVVGLWSVVCGLWLVVRGWWSVVGLWLVCGVWCVVCVCVCVWYRTLHTLFRRRSGNLFWRSSGDVPVTVGTLERRQNVATTCCWNVTRRVENTHSSGRAQGALRALQPWGGRTLGNRGKQINYPPLRWLGPRSSAWGLEGRVKPNYLPRSGWAPGRLPRVLKGRHNLSSFFFQYFYQNQNQNRHSKTDNGVQRGKGTKGGKAARSERDTGGGGAG